MPGSALFQILFDGLLLGAIYAAIGVTLTLIFGVMRIVTFCHGEFLMVAPYLVYVSVTYLGLEAARLLAVETARLVGTDSVPVHQAAMLKVYASELMERLAEAALDLLGPGASLRPGSDATLIAGRFEYAVRDALLYTIGGGTNEIQRTLIATRGLNLPR
ncbi:branched-subunit amino acid ABC-type transport system permease component [Nitrobacteraceae bacterium AZCC 2146]